MTPAPGRDSIADPPDSETVSWQLKRYLEAGIDLLHQPRRHFAEHSLYAVSEYRCQETTAPQGALI